MAWLVVGAIGGSILFALVALGVLGQRTSRALPQSVCDELASIPERRKHQHVVDLELRDGRTVPKVWIAYGKFVALIGGRTITHRYRPRDAIHAHQRGQ